MTAQTIPFSFEDHLIRVYKPNGEPWFVGRDVCRVLEIKNESDALARLDPDEREDGVVITDPIGREQSVIVVSEPGVFRLIFSSRKPAAERFKRWLAHEVLPSLRKSGSYVMPDNVGQAAATPICLFPSDPEGLSVHWAKLATLKECRLIHGSQAAAILWRRLDLPPVELSAVYEADDGRACLAHLLSARDSDGATVREDYACALDDAYAAFNEALERMGLRVLLQPEEGLFVANNGHAGADILSVFRGTPWSDGRHVAALRSLPGASPHKRLSLARMQVRGTFISAGVIDTIVSARPQPIHDYAPSGEFLMVRTN